MNFLFSFLALFLVISVNADVSPLVKYRDVVEKIDVDFLLKNNHLVSFFVKCLLDERYCNKEGMLIRSVIPEILSTDCANCTEKEKEIVRKSMNLIYTTRREDFEKIYDQFDPRGIHRTAATNFMNDRAKRDSSPSSYLVSAELNKCH